MKNDKHAEKVTCYPPRLGQINLVGLVNVDPQGSYTGVPADPHEQPVQDVDDL